MNPQKTNQVPFHIRRHQNWLTIGALYSSFYLCRYNMPIANKAIADQHQWSNTQMGWIITAWFWCYAIGQLINGIITDRIGGKRAVLIGTLGTVIFNIALGLGQFHSNLIYFIVIWGCNGYFQSFGAPGITKINGAWFAIKERGIYSGIFGVMIQAGRFMITFLGGFLIVVLPWSWSFYIPAMVALIMGGLTLLLVADSPEELSYPTQSPVETDEENYSTFEIMKKAFSSPVIWAISLAYFCTGVVRHGLDQWFIKYLQEVHSVSLTSIDFQITAIALPIASIIGCFLAGYLSDKIFNARRGPSAAIFYGGQLVILIIFLFVTQSWQAIILLTLLNFFVAGPHTLLGGAAAMDFGGRKAAGTAAGMIDAWQYFGAGLSGFALGFALDHFGWSAWMISLMGFAFIATLLMASIWNKRAQ